MTDILKRLARLPEDRRAQLLARLRAEVDGGSGARPTSRGSDGPAPLSFNQEPLFSYYRLAPDEPTYSMPFCSRIRGGLDVAALRAAFAGIVTRHEALRTTIVERDDKPVQVVAAEVPVELPVVDVAGAAVAERLARAREMVAAEVRVPFRLNHGPLWTARLYRLDPDDHVLLFNVHHIVFDGWSQAVFAAELGDLYRAAREGRPSALADLPVQYADFAVWQRRWLSGDRLDGLNRWWRERLADAPVLEFPTDRPRPGQVSFAGTVAEFDLPPDVPAAVEALARRVGVTPFVVYTAGFLALLNRYTGQDDLVIGSPNANRRHSELEPVLGFFINQLVLRADVSGDPNFLTLVDRVRDVVRDAFAHGDVPFGKLVEAVRPVRDPSRQPLFQVAFALQEAGAPLALDGTEVTDLDVATGTSRFDMAWNVTRERDGGSRLVVEYSTTLFDADTITGFARHLGELLRACCADPDERLSMVDVMAPGERDALLRFGSGPVRPVREATVVEEFERQVARAPEAVALVVAGAEVSYAELNRRANRLAYHLVAAGAGPGRVVGIALPRSVDLVVAMLAVLKSGAGYLPIDPGHPAARIAEILDDAEAVAVLTHSTLTERVAGCAAPAIVLDRVAAEVAARPSDNPDRIAGPGDVAYVIYTSGTTGKPKGVLIEHRGVVNFIDSVRELFDLTPTDRVLGFAAVNFDVSVFETFAALLTGARLYHTTDEERLSVPRLQALMEDARITVIDLPPTVMALLTPEHFTHLRIVFVGGEAFSAELVNRWNPGRRLFNGYGPTECTVTMIVEECPGRWEITPPIGLPMTNHVAHVVDRDLRPVPFGVAGELVIGGAGLTLGYLNAPELTAEKLVADPFGTAPGGRLYRTGDLVKRQPDGKLVFLGRIDQQVKIRGLRIELGEVEAALAGCPGVAQVAVEPWTDEAGEKHLVGYLTGTDQAPAAIREHLAERLPTYMIPAFFVVLPELPLTSSGKVNRRVLPAPDLAATATGPAATARTETERILVGEIVAPLLRRDGVGVHDDFFALGGNSLQAAQLISAINRRFGVEISLADFFLSPTPAHLAATVDAQQSERMSDDDLFGMIESMSEDEVAARLRGTTS
jgi:amino acid adenylation domain-containing protein